MLGYATASVLLAGLLVALAGRTRRRPGVLPAAAVVGACAAAGTVLGVAGGLLAVVAAGQEAGVVERWGTGVTHRRVATHRPGEGPVVLHAVEVDLAVARPAFSLWPEPVGTGGTAFEDRVGRLPASTGTGAAAATGADLVLNASHFGPIWGDLPFWSYPRRGDPVLPVGRLVQGGRVVGLPQPGWPLLRLGPGPAVELLPEAPPADASPAPGISFAGRSVLVAAGQPTPRSGHLADDRYPRAAVGLDAAGETLFLVVVDGKQPRRSVGLTLAALADRLVAMGVHTALELDGGGSAQLTRGTPGGGVEVVNRPTHQKLPGRERPVANHLVIRWGG